LSAYPLDALLQSGPWDVLHGFHQIEQEGAQVLLARGEADALSFTHDATQQASV
jgi:hypothetical protein